MSFAGESSKGSQPARIETSAGGVVYRRIDGVIHYLLIRDRYDHWGLPKGHVEEGETIEQAALREIEEETGLTRLALGRHLQTIDWYFTLEGIRIHKYCHFFLVECAEGEACPRKSEGISACEWFVFDRAAERISFANARAILLNAVQHV